MRVLLDENINWRLLRYFDADCQVTTVDRQGWKGKRNGELLEQAAKTFDVLVTMDKSIEYQQNIRKYAIGVILISARSNRLQDIQPAMLKVNQVIKDVQPGQVIHVNANVS
ncbi:hypothetical protein F4212_07035 [Candidatus Poribacteria bacterium]|nr:hypothetical protein [Candidatus Poribacteria bacterium]